MLQHSPLHLNFFSLTPVVLSSHHWTWAVVLSSPQIAVGEVCALLSVLLELHCL